MLDKFLHKQKEDSINKLNIECVFTLNFTFVFVFVIISSIFLDELSTLIMFSMVLKNTAIFA